MSTGNGRFSVLRGFRAIIILVLAIVFVGATAYSILSDSSIHGLTTRITYANRYCAISPATSVKTVTFYILASVWSTSSLPTSISKVSFSLAVDGFGLGASQVSD